MMIGIDLGTTNSLVAAWDGEQARLLPNALGNWLTPSVVGLDDHGLLVAGDIARERLQTHPHLTAALFKRHMGSAQQTWLGDRPYGPEELSAMLLRSLKEDAERALGEPVTEAVISVPAYFSDAQRKATRIAGELAGLKVEKLINEPTAAALAYGIHQRDEATFLVFDLGGGTFDVSVLELFEGVMEVRASAGDNFLGGEDFDDCLVEYFIAQVGAQALPDVTQPGLAQRLRREAQRVRHALGTDTRVRFVLREANQEWGLDITQGQLQTLTQPLLDRLRAPIERALRDARIRAGDLDQVLLVGGTTRMPLVRKLVAALFGRIPAMHLNPDEVVAQGAAIQAALKARHASLEEVVLTDVCPYTLGIETCVRQGREHQDGHYLPIIERNSVVPVSRQQTVYTLQDNQKVVKLGIYQGESRLVKNNIFLGELEVPVPPMPAGQVGVEVRFTYDTNGLLEAQAHIPSTGEQRSLVIENNPGVLSPEQIAERLKALAALKVHPRDQQANTLLMARLDRLYQECLGEQREYVAHLARRFQQLLDSQDEHLIRQARTEIAAQASELDGQG
ncbi:MULTISPECIES: Hsp70 family protein [unclassified Pseudomonas]|uniref:Hsp70 family protein n=1 Tax=unclassified Pseudomonas TaxID=196821 RepID=UPI000BD6633F|nr:MULTISPECIES: molecular chaperone HscC [unclassified Pseudomonas]PVZ13595.1 molecular chaperone HscC [Pseudomonas sp. URIL14HWK12:I12]PVZ23901.1 molecular chaperone HscC [Pseudomonas sp. URIL14HWK12:I10]PVZ33460.1 molecular chaperone HscC [Pseudomonas sp. URIL14HWK12:I11]SNZ11643.1 molecular chaperone HscC [Pseudomonas sp. URIL14HWK12:I9]